MMKTTNKSFLLLSLLILFFSCNKEKRFSNKLIKGDVWIVKDISVNGSGLAYFGKWDITSDGSIYDNVPRLNWSFESKSTIIEWQFQDKGKHLQLNYVQLCEECDGDQLSDIDLQAYGLTGKYSVEKHGRNKMKFTSETTLGHSTKKVCISIERDKN